MAHLLVVEDDQSIRDMLQELLIFEGYAVTVAVTTGAAIHALHRQAYDLILTDGMEFRPPYAAAQSQGFEALQRAARGQPVVLFTAFAEAGRLDLAEHQLAAVWLKPMEIDDLVTAIAGVLDQRPSGVRGSA